MVYVACEILYATCREAVGEHEKPMRKVFRRKHGNKEVAICEK